MNSYGSYPLKCNKHALPATPTDNVYVEARQDFAIVIRKVTNKMQLYMLIYYS
jgi:hypothetical protein